jgi:hypothetical protein
MYVQILILYIFHGGHPYAAAVVCWGLVLPNNMQFSGDSRTMNIEKIFLSSILFFPISILYRNIALEYNMLLGYKNKSLSGIGFR